MNGFVAAGCLGMSPVAENCVVVLVLALSVLAMVFAFKKHLWMLTLGIVLFGFGFSLYLKPTGIQRRQAADSAVAKSAPTSDAVASPSPAGMPNGAADKPDSLSACLEAFSKSLSAFYPSRGDYEEGRARGQSHWYWLFHALAILYVSLILAALFGAEFVCRARAWLRRRVGRSLNVFWGYSEEAKTIAEGVDGGKDSVVFVMPEKRLWTSLCDDESIHVIATSGWKWILGKAGEAAWLSSAERHFFMGPDGHRNVADAEALIRSYRGSRRITVYVRIAATADDDVLYKWADKWNRSEDKNVEVIIVREESLVSRQFLLDNPMLDCPGIAVNTETATVSGAFKVLVLGFGAQGEALLNDMICDSQFLTSCGTVVSFEAHVFDRDAAAYGAYQEICGEAVKRYHVKFDGTEIGSAKFWRGFKEEMALRPYSRVVVCLRDDRENICLANDIARIYREIRLRPNGVVFARVRDSLIDAYVDSTFKGNERIRTFTPFGAMRDTYSFGNIVTRKWEKGAVWLNGDWGNPPGTPHDEAKDAAKWKRASCFNKESSRASFFFQRNLLRLIGYMVDETSDENDCFNDDDAKNHLVTLAENEHLRWMAYHFVRGVKTWDPRPDEIDAKAVRTGEEVKHNAIDEINAHADLVDYAVLPSVDALFDPINERHGHPRAKDTQEKDKGFIRSAAMRQSGLGIRRV